HVGAAIPQQAVLLLGQVGVDGGDALAPHPADGGVAGELVRLAEVLVVAVHAGADVGGAVGPRTATHVDVGAHEAEGAAAFMHGEGGAFAGGVVLGIAGVVAEDAELQDVGAGLGHVHGVTALLAGAQVHVVGGDARGRVEGGQQAVGE